jgi:hypothetical protein
MPITETTVVVLAFAIGTSLLVSVVAAFIAFAALGLAARQEKRLNLAIGLVLERTSGDSSRRPAAPTTVLSHHEVRH